MQLVERWTKLAERLLPFVGLPVGVALVVTVLWLLTGWSWFDLGPWPWALGALPVALLAALRLAVGLVRSQKIGDAFVDLGTCFAELGRTVPESAAPVVVAALRLARARWGRSGLDALPESLSEEDQHRIRYASEPLREALTVLQERAPDADLGPVFVAMARVDAGAVPLGGRLASMSVTLLYLCTLPVGLVTTTGWWTFLAMAGISVAYLALEEAADALERPLLGDGGVPVDEILQATERTVTRRLKG